MRFLQNLAFWLDSGSPLFFYDSYKTSEMNELDIELSKKSKIIEIGSVEKKSYGSLKLAKIRKISEIPDFRTVKSGFASQNCPG